MDFDEESVRARARDHKIIKLVHEYEGELREMPFDDILSSDRVAEIREEIDLALISELERFDRELEFYSEEDLDRLGGAE